MFSVRVKICGIGTVEEALAAVEEGAHALGFLFAPSPRRIAPEEAARIVERIPPFIGRVGVFVNEREDVVKETAAFCGLDTLQFHGEETKEYCRRFRQYKVIKAFAAHPFLLPERCAEYGTSAILLDTAYTGKKGGGGETFDWNMAVPFSRSAVPLILAGGLNEGNICEALHLVRPYGVDVSSGVETKGCKDRAKIRSFISQVRRWEESFNEELQF